jgi:hypothetical protein
MYRYPERQLRMSEYECQLPEEIRTALEGTPRVAVPPRSQPTPPPVYPRPPVVIPSPPGAKPSAAPWIIALLGIVLIGMVANNGNRSLAPVTGQVAVPAQRATVPNLMSVPQPEIGAQRMTTMPDGSTVPTTFKGHLSDVSQLPYHGAQIGDMWGVGHNLWVLTTPANSYKVGWVDPPVGDEPEVRRALPVDSVEVRRAEMVIPRAELVRLSGD